MPVAGNLTYSYILQSICVIKFLLNLYTAPEENVIQIKPIDMFMTLGDLIRTNQCYESISLEMVNFMSRTNQRIQYEENILQILAKAVNSFDPLLKVATFGSVEYSFSGTNTNYNILIDTRKYR